MVAKLGVDHHRAKLTPDYVRFIRKLRAQGLSIFRICEEIDWLVSEDAVKAVVQGRTWKEVDAPPGDPLTRRGRKVKDEWDTLAEETVRLARRLRSEGYTYKQIVRRLPGKYPIPTVADCITGKTWRNVEYWPELTEEGAARRAGSPHAGLHPRPAGSATGWRTPYNPRV